MFDPARRHVSTHLRGVLRIPATGSTVPHEQVILGVLHELEVPAGVGFHGTYELSDALLPILEDVIKNGDNDDPYRADLIAKAAVDALDVAYVLDCLRAFGASTANVPRPKGGLRVDDLERVLESMLIERLVPRLRKMLRRWRDRNAWSRDYELGIVPIPRRRSA